MLRCKIGTAKRSPSEGNPSALSGTSPEQRQRSNRGGGSTAAETKGSLPRTIFPSLADLFPISRIYQIPQCSVPLDLALTWLNQRNENKQIIKPKPLNLKPQKKGREEKVRKGEREGEPTQYITQNQRRGSPHTRQAHNASNPTKPRPWQLRNKACTAVAKALSSPNHCQAPPSPAHRLRAWRWRRLQALWRRLSAGRRRDRSPAPRCRSPAGTGACLS